MNAELGRARLITLIPELRARVWGGRRFGTDAGGQPIGEAWITGPAARVRPEPDSGVVGSGDSGPGPTLEELARAWGRDLVGSTSPWADRFPLLVKLLDPAAWLSVQVHPSDDLAIALEGPGSVGKEEAWVVLEASPGAALLAGVRRGVAAEAVRAAIRDGGSAALLTSVPALPGTSVMVRAGLLHAVGPGVLLYEVQQPSDLTYRVDDWGRPPTSERPLHVAQSLACVRPEIEPQVGAANRSGRTSLSSILTAQHFCLDLAEARPGTELSMGTRGTSPHLITVVEGRATVVALGSSASIGPLESVVVPAIAGPYRISGDGAEGFVAILARLPDCRTPDGIGTP